MDRKLYEVMVTQVVYTASESEEDAVVDAMDFLDTLAEESDETTYEVTPAVRLPVAWRRALPAGDPIVDEEAKPCSWWLEKMEED